MLFAAFASLLSLLAVTTTMVNSKRLRSSANCGDRAKWCSKLGNRVSLSRCYDPRHRSRCCQTCEKLKLPLKDCEYGDRGDFCSTIDRERPVSDCYASNRTCCQTCHLYDSGIPGCPFGDRSNMCSKIGDKYAISSCYDHEIHCCSTCMKLRTSIPGDTSEDTRCRYGDRGQWCQNIGTLYSMDSCEQSADVCCETCHLFEKAKKKFPLIQLNLTTSTQPAKATAHYTTSDVLVTQTPTHNNSIREGKTTVSQLNRKTTLQATQEHQSNKKLNSSSLLPWQPHGNITVTTDKVNSSTINPQQPNKNIGIEESIHSKEMSPDKSAIANTVSLNDTDGNIDNDNTNLINFPSIFNETAENSDNNSDMNVLHKNVSYITNSPDSKESQISLLEETDIETTFNKVSSGSQSLQQMNSCSIVILLLTAVGTEYIFKLIHNNPLQS